MGKMVSLETANNDGIDGSTKHLPLELDILSSCKQEKFIDEYNFVLNDRLKRLQRFHAVKKEQIEKRKMLQINKMEIKNKTVPSKNINQLHKILENEQNKNEKLKTMIHRALNEQKNVNQQTKECEERMKCSLLTIERTLDLELNDLNNEWRDYRAHIDTKRKMEKCATL